MSWGNKTLVALGLLALLLFVAFSSLKDGAAWTVTLIGAGFVVFVLGLEQNERERKNQLNLFGAAMVLRLFVMYIIYKTGLNNKSELGSGDDAVWGDMWVRSLNWGQDVKGFPNSVGSVFGEMISGQNTGYNYLGSLFYLSIVVKSQIALSALNCIIGAATVPLIYRTGRLFWSESAALFTGWLALLSPSYIFWSTVSQKEACVIFCSAFTLWGMARFSRTRSREDAAITLLGVLVTSTFRFYMGPIMGLGMVLSFILWRAKRPGLTLSLIIGSGTIAVILAFGLRLVHLDIAGFMVSHLEAAHDFGNSMSGGKNAGHGFGNRSGVVMPYDVTTPQGVGMTLLVGGTYVLFSPFPWQLSGRQIAVLPELIAWWFLVISCIVPGVVYMWRANRRILFTMIFFLAPMILAYSLAFGNVFLTYRMRSQMMPYYFMMAAGGYEWNRIRRRLARLSHDPQANARHAALERLRAVLRRPSTAPF